MFRIPDGLSELKTLLENHITNVGLTAIEKLGQVCFYQCCGLTCGSGSVLDPYSGAFWIRNTDPDPSMYVINIGRKEAHDVKI